MDVVTEVHSIHTLCACLSVHMYTVRTVWPDIPIEQREREAKWTSIF